MRKVGEANKKTGRGIEKSNSRSSLICYDFL